MISGRDAAAISSPAAKLPELASGSWIFSVRSRVIRRGTGDADNRRAIQKRLARADVIDQSQGQGPPGIDRLAGKQHGSSAAGRPTRRADRCVPPAPGLMPSLTSGRPNLLPSATCDNGRPWPAPGPRPAHCRPRRRSPAWPSLRSPQRPPGRCSPCGPRRRPCELPGSRPGRRRREVRRPPGNHDGPGVRVGVGPTDGPRKLGQQRPAKCAFTGGQSSRSTHSPSRIW